MAVGVLVPWSPGCPHREAAWAWVRAKHEEHGWEIVEGHAPPGPWCKALAVQDALSRTTADLLVIADADCWSDGIPTAIEAVEMGHPWARPHDYVYRLTEAATARQLAGAEDMDCDPQAYRGVDGGGLVVIQRVVYEDCPLDPRFAGWGGEDVSWSLALHVLVGAPYRVASPLLHLWHPPQADASPRRGPGGARYMNDNNQALHERYKTHRRSWARMRELVDEAKGALNGERPSGPQTQGDARAPAVA